MESSTSNDKHNTATDNIYPAVNILPAFQIRGCYPNGGSGVIRMKKGEYDELLKRQPKAALRYIDESDGEVILVGSSFELDQRLKEPVDFPSVDELNLSLSARANALHSFDIDKEQPLVVSEWRQFDRRTREEGRRAKDIFFGRNVHPPQPPPKDGKSSAVVRFGEVSPPRSSLKTSPQPVSVENAHTSRWASYSSLPGSLDKEAVPVTTGDPPSKPTMHHEAVQQPNPYSHVRSSTLQVPATPKQQSEHQPLVDMFYSAPGQSEPKTSASQSKDQVKEWQPLLSMFEGQLAELAGPSLSTSGQNKDGRPSSPKGPFAQKSGELLSQSIQSLLNGVGLLAATFKKTNSELQQQIALAQQDFPNNMEKALKASLAAIDSLRSMIPAAKAEGQAENDGAESTENSETAAANPDTVPQDSGEEALKAKTLSNRYKLQRHLLHPRPAQKDSDLQQISDMLEELEVQTVTGNITADVLMHSKIHKVLKRVTKSNKVPGDQQYRFRERASDIVQAWMKTLDKHRRTLEAANNDPNKAPETITTSQQSEQGQTSTRNEDIKTEKSDQGFHARPAKQGDQLVHAWASGQDDFEGERVEEAIEKMRQELLLLKLLPPTGRPHNSFYTRSDILEAYMKKFQEFQAMVETQNLSKPAVSDAATSTYVELKSSGTQGGTARDDSAVHDLLDPFSDQNAVLSGQQTNQSQPRNTDDGDSLYSGFVRGRSAVAPVELPKPQEIPDKAPKSTPSSQKPSIGYSTAHFPPPPPSEFFHWPLPTSGSRARNHTNHSNNNNDNNIIKEKPTPRPRPQQRVIRERQSWHPMSVNTAARTEPYPFESPGFSPAAAMQRYPPITQIDPTMKERAIPPPSRSNGTQPSSGPMNSHPKQVAQARDEPQFKRRSMPMHFRSLENLRAPGARALDQGSHMPNRGQPSNPKTENQKKPSKEAADNMKKCIQQLVEMGFARGKAEAVTYATLGNLEMALDVLNEDSAAWQQKAEVEEETAKKQENVPGSWGSWDDELYG